MFDYIGTVHDPRRRNPRNGMLPPVGSERQHKPGQDGLQDMRGDSRETRSPGTGPIKKEKAANGDPIKTTKHV